MKFLNKFNIGDKISILLDKRETIATLIYKDVTNEQILCHLKSNYGWKIMFEGHSDKIKQAYNKYKNNSGSFWWVSGKELHDIKLIQRCTDILDIE